MEGRYVVCVVQIVAMALIDCNVILSRTECDCLVHLGTLLFQMGRVEEAERFLRHALTLQPSHYGAANNLKVVQHHKLKTQQQKQK